jgi:DNA mismatch repair protein MutS
MAELTPMMKQYYRLKKESGDAVLFFRLGDFYEMFEQDAKEVSSILNITLTKRNGTPMCGIPYHAAQSYIAKLLKAGKKIAVCEQVSLPEAGKGIVDREIIEVITPGTVLEEDILSGKENNYLASLGTHGSTCSFSYIDCSTGDFFATSWGKNELYEKLKEEFEKVHPAELLIQQSVLEDVPKLEIYLRDKKKLLINRYPDWSYNLNESFSRLCDLFHVVNLKAFGIEDSDPVIFSAGVLLDYVKETSRAGLDHITTLQVYSRTQYLGMDESTIRNLEIFSNMHDGSEHYSLLEIIDNTKTAMGGRRIKNWLAKPLVDSAHIQKRLEKVRTLYHHQSFLNEIRDIFSSILDTDRLTSRIAVEKAHAKDILGLGGSVEASLEVVGKISYWEDGFVFELPDKTDLEKNRNVCTLVRSAIAEDPSVLLTEGKLIRKGYSRELDTLRDLKKNSQAILDEYLEQEKKSTGISTLRIKYNKIIGHFLEVTKSNTSLVPDHFIRRQSLVGSERYTTERLSELESEINNATEKIVELEKGLFLSVRKTIAENIPALLRLSGFIARLDCLCSFAVTATRYGYTEPIVDDSGTIRIEEGRHPVVEAHLPPGEFIPNSMELDNEKRTFILLTGPNMAGKSTFLRQTALIVLLAQIGSFVPAGEAEIGVVDKIFCRVGASDNLSRGESTFLVEMNETSYILRAATNKSLIIMDEVGRGTGTKDGLSIAWAVSEYILGMLGTKTLFATHFHELTEMRHPRLRSMYMTITEDRGEIVFLKKVKDGKNINSYGIKVAQLAGLPLWVVARAEEKMKELEHEIPDVKEEGPNTAVQQELFQPVDVVEKELKLLDINAITPMEALQYLDRWKKSL